MGRRPSKSYPDQVRMVREVLSGVSATKVAADNGICRNTLHGYLRVRGYVATGRGDSARWIKPERAVRA